MTLLTALGNTYITKYVFLLKGSSTEAKNWRYWPNIGCFEFSFERTVFFELTNEATRLSTIEGSELRK